MVNKSPKRTIHMYEELSEKHEWLATEIVDVAFTIHKALGPGLLESVYEKCFCYELSKRGIQYACQQRVPIVYDSLTIDEGLRLDIVVEDSVLIELKAQEDAHPVWQAQLLSYLRLTNKRL